MKVCGHCGRVEGDQWKRHWLNNHPGEDHFELASDGIPVIPWCDNWKAISVVKLLGMEPAPPVNAKIKRGRTEYKMTAMSQMARSDFGVSVSFKKRELKKVQK